MAMSEIGHFIPFVKKSEPFIRKSMTQGKLLIFFEKLGLALGSNK